MFRVTEIMDIKGHQEAAGLLGSLALKTPEESDYTVGVYEGDKLVGTGSLVGDVLQGIGVLQEFQGEGISALVVTRLIKKALELGKEELFVFTKPEEVRHFREMGFKTVAEARPYAALLEWGPKGIEQYKAGLRELSRDKPDGAACVVVNCNPFTLGHRYLVEKAARESPWLYIIVVEEERSLFPFAVRWELVKKGTADLRNITLIPGGKYVISNLTFPAYFTREADLTAAQASLDLAVFLNHVAPSLKAAVRCVGEEPYCPVTSHYNRLMKEILVPGGITVREIARLERHGGAVSASRVRELVRGGRLDEVRELVPESTYDYLVSPEAEEVLAMIKTSNSRH